MDDFDLVNRFILDKTGIVITDTNINAVKRFVSKKLANGLHINKYLNLLNIDEQEFHQLIKVVTINETYFFREEKYFKLLNEELLPKIKERSKLPPVIWSGATSTGEEAISIALLIHKFWKDQNINYKPVVATDIDMHSMERLHHNEYAPNSIRNDGKHFHNLIEQNSKKLESGKISINPNIMDLIETKKVNLIKDDFNRLFTQKPTLICLCNVLIYMDREIRERIIDKAVNTLEDNGYLFVSSSNTATIKHPNLELLQSDKAFYFKKKG